jgi:hypothetical protein
MKGKYFYVTGLMGSYGELKYGPVMVLNTVDGDYLFQWDERRDNGEFIIDSKEISPGEAWPVFDALCQFCERQEGPIFNDEEPETWQRFVDQGIWAEEE